MTFRELRKRRFDRAVDLAAAAGIEPSTLHKIEAGRVPDPRFSTIKALADALGVTPEVVARAVRASAKVAA